VVLLADDVAAWSDVPAWARMKGHSVTLHEDDGWTAYRVVIGAPRRTAHPDRST
jgi:tRNA 2-thiouridine synthesizing protein A